MKGKHGVSAARNRQADAEERAAGLETEVRRLKDQLRIQEKRERTEIERLGRDIKGWAVKIAREDVAILNERLNTASRVHAAETAALRQKTIDVVEVMGKWIYKNGQTVGDDARWVSPFHIDAVATLSGLSAAQITTLVIDGHLQSKGHPNVAELHAAMNEGDRGRPREDIGAFASSHLQHVSAGDEIARQIRRGHLTGSLVDRLDRRNGQTDDRDDFDPTADLALGED